MNFANMNILEFIRSFTEVSFISSSLFDAFTKLSVNKKLISLNNLSSTLNNLNHICKFHYTTHLELHIYGYLILVLWNGKIRLFKKANTQNYS